MFGLLPRLDLIADLRRQTRELRASRARIVVAADAERLRIERDLHDGAQQHLTSLSVRLLMAAKLADQDPELASLLEQLGAEVSDTAREVRGLAHGIYPPLLRANGLADALFAAAGHCTLPARVQAGSLGRYLADIEAAVYFCCLEAMQNACKHAGERATIRLCVREEAGTLTFEVTDDGAGFDATTRGLGTGLLNMADRLGAFGGHLRVDSAPGQGTRVTGTVPVPAAVPAAFPEVVPPLPSGEEPCGKQADVVGAGCLAV
jgi:signal transduction histidine kinase